MHRNRMFVGCPDVQQPLHEATHLTLVTTCCDMEIKDHKLRFQILGK